MEAEPTGRRRGRTGHRRSLRNLRRLAQYLMVSIGSLEALNDSLRLLLQEVGVAVGSERPVLPVVLETGVPLPALIADLKYLDAASIPVEVAGSELLVTSTCSRLYKSGRGSPSQPVAGSPTSAMTTITNARHLRYLLQSAPPMIDLESEIGRGTTVHVQLPGCGRCAE